jgi:hypothetical protein
VLADLFEITREHIDRLADLGALVLAECSNRRGRGLLISWAMPAVG